MYESDLLGKLLSVLYKYGFDWNNELGPVKWLDKKLENEVICQDAIIAHWGKSHEHGRCWQNDLDLYYSGGMDIDLEKEYWPPVEEFRAKCDEYCNTHHPLLNPNVWSAKNPKTS